MYTSFIFTFNIPIVYTFTMIDHNAWSLSYTTVFSVFSSIQFQFFALITDQNFISVTIDIFGLIDNSKNPTTMICFAINRVPCNMTFAIYFTNITIRIMSLKLISCFFKSMFIFSLINNSFRGLAQLFFSPPINIQQNISPIFTFTRFTRCFTHLRIHFSTATILVHISIDFIFIDPVNSFTVSRCFNSVVPRTHTVLTVPATIAWRFDSIVPFVQQATVLTVPATIARRFNSIVPLVQHDTGALSREHIILIVHFTSLHLVTELNIVQV
uniref:Uncharacterized protein n=1 Tax=Cacopsylla melanoneura TaxID=428564 RepID=A0A8D8SLV3_9HEMI